MAILRADLPVTEDALMGEGLISERCHARYTILHGREFKGELISTMQDFGFSTELTVNNQEAAKLRIFPNKNIETPRELIVRSVAAVTLETTVKRFYIPNDPEFEEMEFEMGTGTVEVTYGRPIAVASFNVQMGLFVPNIKSSVCFLRSVLWVADSDKKAAMSRHFHDEWSE